MQSRDQANSNERRAAKGALDRITKLGASRPWIVLFGQLLKHAFLPKVVNQHSFPRSHPPPHDRQILPDWRVAAKLFDQRIAIRWSLGKEQDSGGVAIDAVHDKSSLPFRFQFGGKKRLGGGRVGVIGRHREQFGGLIQRDNGIVFVEFDQIP